MACRVNAIYAIYESRKHWHCAIKMELGKAGPHFVTLSNDACLLSSDDKKLDITDCRAGDRYFVEEIWPIKAETAVQMDDGSASWPPKVTARVGSARLISRLRTEERIAIALELRGSAQIPRLHYRCYDPFTLSERALPRSCNDQKPKNLGLVKITYAVHAPGTWIDPSGQLLVPHDYVGDPEDFAKQPVPLYVPRKWRALSEDIISIISEFLGHPEAEKLESFVVDDLLLAGAAAMQATTKSRARLASDTVVPLLKDSADDTMTFVAQYLPARNRCNATTDLAKAARVLREGQPITVRPVACVSEAGDRFVGTWIDRSKQTATGTIEFEYRISMAKFNKFWGHTDVLAEGNAWRLEPATQCAITTPFRVLLQNRGLTSLRKQAAYTKSVRIIEALLGRIDAIPPPGRERLLSVVLGAGRSGKTTGITNTVREAIDRMQDGIVVTAKRNADIEAIATVMAHVDELKGARILLLQSAKHISESGYTEKDPAHQWRLPELLSQLAKGEVDQHLNRIEVDLAKKAAYDASIRYDALDMDWTSALRGTEDAPGVNDFAAGAILGTIGTLTRLMDTIAPVAKRIICDESNELATIEMIQLLVAWNQVESLMLVGDISEAEKTGAPLDEKIKQFGFDSVLSRAASDPHVARLELTQSLVQLLAQADAARKADDVALGTPGEKDVLCASSSKHRTSKRSIPTSEDCET